MTENWAYNLDLLAQNNILDFDAPAFIKGQPARYAGSPNFTPSPFIDGLPDTSNLRQPDNDQYTAPNKDIVKNPSWKKWVFGAVAIGGLVFGGWKLKSKVIPYVKSLYSKVTSKTAWKNGWTKVKNKLKWPKIKKFFKDKATAVKDFFVKCWTKVKGWFKKTPTPTP